MMSTFKEFGFFLYSFYRLALLGALPLSVLVGILYLGLLAVQSWEIAMIDTFVIPLLLFIVVKYFEVLDKYND